jgi:putative transposase
MQRISYDRHRFPPEVIRYAVWLYLRFTLSYRDVEELLAERGLEVSYETVRRWVLKFGPALRTTCDGCDHGRRTPGTWTRWWSRSRAGACTCGAPSTAKARSSTSWCSRGAKAAALRLMRKLVRKQGYGPRVLGLSGILCAGPVDHHARMNLSSKMMANWVFASPHSRGDIFHSAAV